MVDNAYSRSGFQFDGNAKVNPNLTAGFTIVVGIAAGARSHQVNEVNAGDGLFPNGGGDDAVGGLYAANGNNVETLIAIEQAAWYLDHKQLGRLTVGRTNGASAATSQVDLGGAGVIANANIGLSQRGFTMVNSDGSYATGNSFANALIPTNVSAPSWSAFLGGGGVNVSGLNRSNAVVYSTPTLGGFSLSAAYGEDDMWDAAARYAGEFSGFRIAAAVAYVHNVSGVNDTPDAQPNGLPSAGLNNRPDTNRWQGSASVLHVASGLFLSGSYVRESYNGGADYELKCSATSATGACTAKGENRDDVTLMYLIGGISKNWTGLGNTVLYGEWARVDDGAAGFLVNGEQLASTEATMWGLGIVQNIDAAAMELYLSYRVFSAEATEVGGDKQSFQDFGVAMGGARIRF